MINKEPNVYSFNDECYVFYGDYKKLQIENQQLKSTLEEIREYINKNKYFYSGVQGEDLEIGLFENEIIDLLQIIDKKNIDK